MQSSTVKPTSSGFEIPTISIGNPAFSLSYFIPKLDWVISREWLPIKDNELFAAIKNIIGNFNIERDSDLIIKAFASEDFYRLAPSLKEIFKKLNDDDLNLCLKILFSEFAFKESELFIKKLQHFLELEKVEQAQKITALDAAIIKGGRAERESKVNAVENHSTLYRLVKFYILNTLEFVLDTLMFVFQLKDVEDGDASNLERQMVAQMRYQAFRDTITVMGGWLLALSLLTESALLTAAIAATIGLTGIAVGYVYVKYLKPSPAHVHPTVEKTAAAIRGEIPPILCRDEIVDLIIQILNSNEQSSIRMLPMLIGDTGVGKSDIINALAQRIASGNVPDFLKGKRIYSVNAGLLVSGSPSNPTEHMELIQKRLHDYEKDCILFIDEAHCAFDSEIHKVLGQQLKSLMDIGGFPYMIFATTTKEYQKWIGPDEAFVRRIKLTKLESTLKEQTWLIANDMVLREASELIVEPEAITAAVEAGYATDSALKDQPKPWLAKHILTQAFAQKRIGRNRKEKEDLQKDLDARKLIESHLEIGERFGSSLAQHEITKYENQLQLLNDAIKSKEANLAKSEENFEKYRALLNEYEKLRTEIKNLSMAIKRGQEQNQASNKDLLMQYVLKTYYLQPAMAERIKECESVIGENSIRVTKEDINSVIAEMTLSTIEPEKEGEK